MLNNEIIKRQWLELSDCISAGKYLHYSFDFWNTIAFSNKKFKEARTDFIHNLFNDKYNKEVIKKAFTKVGYEYNLSVDNNGGTITINELYLKVFECIGVNENFDLGFIKSSIFELFLKYPPSISENFINILESNERNKISLSITSNTTFIPGFIIEEFLKQIGILNNFSFCVFSDAVQVAKPNQKIFEIVCDRLKNRTISSIDVLHIGDNYKADYLGAQHSGLSAFYIDSNSFLMNSRHALHVIKEIESLPFSALEYSKFKFGDGGIAKKYGNELFDYFQQSLLPELITKHKNFLIYSSPYAQIPTSSYYLTQSFFSAFSDYLTSNQIKNVDIRFCKIKRCQTYTDDYGALSAEARFNLIKNDTYEFVDIPSREDVCIFIDDVSITGTHQRVVENLIHDCEIKTNSIFLYYAKLSNPNVCPSFENYLNYSFVDDFTKLIEVIVSDDYRITTRTTKYLLSSSLSEFNYFLAELIAKNKFEVLEELLSMSGDNKYNSIEQYMTNLNELKRVLSITQQ
jgi:FMN phosphatase YigB (HAD superfamily)